MSWFRWLGWVAALCVVFTGGVAWAASAADVHDAEQTYEAFFAAQSRGYDEVSAVYRAALMAAPDNGRLALGRAARKAQE